MISKKYFKPNNKRICYCMTPELIENYDLVIADEEKVWICHHRKEINIQKNQRRKCQRQ